MSCPTEQQLAAYADRQLIGEERHAVEHHLSDCRDCAEQIAFLTQDVSLEAHVVPPELVRKANALGRTARDYPIPTWSLVALGTAAILLLAISMLEVSRPAQQMSRDSSLAFAPSPPTQSKPAIDDAESKMDLRGGQDRRLPVVVYPSAGQKQGRVSLIVRWLSSDLAESYEIELLTDTGNLLWSTHVSSTSVALPPRIHLISGRTYYLRISILQKDGAIQRNKAVPFVAG